jgi:hypothetical protein
MRDRLLVFAALAAGFASNGGPAAQAASGGLPREVSTYVARMDGFCRKVGGRRGSSPGLVTSVDLTADRVPDHVINEGHYNCLGAASAFSAGHNGAAVTIFVGRPDRAELAYEGYAHGVHLTREPRGWAVRLDTYGLNCGQKPTDPPAPFSEAVFCTRPLSWDAVDRRFVLAPLP